MKGIGMGMWVLLGSSPQPILCPQAHEAGGQGKAAGTDQGGRPPEPLGTPQCLQGACDRRGDGLAVAISFCSKSACCLSCALLYFSERFFTFTLAT